MEEGSVLKVNLFEVKDHKHCCDTHVLVNA